MDDGGEDEDDDIEHIGSPRKLFTQYSNVFNSPLVKTIVFAVSLFFF